MTENKQEKYVSFKIFSWVIAIIIVVFGWLFSINEGLSAKVNDISIDSMTIQTQLSQIQTDIGWIKTTLSK